MTGSGPGGPAGSPPVGGVPPGSCLPARPVALRTFCGPSGRARSRPDGPQNVDQASASRLRKVRSGSIRQATRDITWRNGVPAPVLRGPDDGPPADEPGADDLGPGDHAAAHVAGRSPHRTFSVGRSSVREGLPYVTVRGSPNGHSDDPRSGQRLKPRVDSHPPLACWGGSALRGLAGRTPSHGLIGYSYTRARSEGRSALLTGRPRPRFFTPARSRRPRTR